MKPKSYISKTSQWDEFPNGRWGPSRSAAFSNHEWYDDHIKRQASLNMGDRKKHWGEEVKSLDNVVDVFRSFLNGKIKKFPFAEKPVSPETTLIVDVLNKMLDSNLLPINS